jgi:CTP synthase (UTP-ammonia lyase)
MGQNQECRWCCCAWWIWDSVSACNSLLQTINSYAYIVVCTSHNHTLSCSGFLGKVCAAKYCCENSVPFLGICLGFQAMMVEYSRNILNWQDANSTEFDEETKNLVVLFMPEINKDNMGGTMRLGSCNTAFTHPTHEDGSPSIAKIMYGNASIVSERHRHRYNGGGRVAQVSASLLCWLSVSFGVQELAFESQSSFPRALAGSVWDAR